MPFVTSLEMLRDAQKRNYAVGAFNIENMEMAQAVISAAEAEHAPVMLQTTPGTLSYASPATFAAIVRSLAEKSKAYICLHLDHGSSYELAAQCLIAGYSSVMIDGSRLSLEDNIALAKRVVDLSSLVDIPVEAELGKVGGKEDDLQDAGQAYTDPDTAKEFVKRSGVQSLAVAIGTAHGVYKVTPVLDVERLKQIRSKVDIPLVLHGASGLSGEQVQSCVHEGICKVNFATELRIAYTDGVKKVLADNPIDPKKYGNAGRENVQALCQKWMRLTGASGKA